MRGLPFLLAFLLLSGCASDPPQEDHGVTHAAPEKLFPDVHGIAFDAATGTLWVATHTGLHRRVGEGAWETLGPRQDLMGFSPDPLRAGVFWASGHPASGGNLGLIRSTDGGVTWTQLGAEGMDFHAMIATSDALYGSFRGAVHRSTDGGVAWEQVSLLGAAAFAEAGGTLFASTGKDVRVSADRGASWRALAAEPAYGLAAASADVLYAGIAGGARKSVDGGATWSPLPLDAGDGVVGHVSVAKGDPDVVHAATYTGFVWRSDDAGATWSAVPRS